MAVRLVITTFAPAGRGDEFAAAYAARCAEVATEPGCQQFEVFRSVSNPDKFTLLETWADAAALEVHSKVKRPPMPEGLGFAGGQREDYQYNRTR